MTNQAARIRNPILPGFNPDPSIVRVGDDYYIATSTFEWYPGVQIHHSRDLIHWRLLPRPLNRASQLNMLGDPDSCGVWAPCLSYADGLFWLIYTDVKRYGRTTQAGATGASLRDTHNYLVTSPRIDGEWSDPVYLNSSGFDPSLFHDEDGRKYLVNMRWDHRPGCNRFSGIVLQEYSPAERKLVGPVHMIFQGTPLGLHRRTPSLQAQRLLLPADRRGRHRMGACRHHGALARAYRTVRIAPGRHHSDGTPPPGYRTAARRACRPGGDSERRDLHGASLRPAHSESGTLHAGPRNRHPTDGVVAGRLASYRGWSGRPLLGGRRAGPAPARVPRITGARGLRHPKSAVGFSVAAVSLAGGTFQPDRTARVSAPLRPRDAGQPLPAVPGGPAPAVALLQRRDRDGVRARPVPADGRPGLLLQRLASFTTSTSRTTRSWASTSGSCRACPTRCSRMPSARRSGFPRERRCICAWKWISSVSISRTASRDGEWSRLPGPLDASILSDEAAAPGTPNFTGAFVGVCCQDLAGTCRPADFDYFVYRERSYRAEPFGEDKT